MRTTPLMRVLNAALLAGAPFLLGECLAQSSCPDNGVEPPLAESRPVEASFADGGPLSTAQCDQVCNEGRNGVITCVREAPQSVLCITHAFPCEGRRPVGLRTAVRRPATGFECHLADAAWLERASVDAFRVLRRELHAHGAPRRLLRAASRSARDERRHARASRALARSFGVEVAAVERDEAPARSLAAIALDNAVEGCVRETWGALIALHQASSAREPAVRAALGRIARDEVRHADLAWQIERWLRPRLSPEERRRVRQARAVAVAELEREVRQELARDERERLGLPSAAAATAMLGELERALGLSLT